MTTLHDRPWPGEAIALTVAVGAAAVDSAGSMNNGQDGHSPDDGHLGHLEHRAQDPPVPHRC